MSDEVVMGCLVRAEWKGHSHVVGVVVGTSRNGTCWVLKTRKGETAFLKRYCERVRSNQAGKGSRRIKQGEKVKQNAKARAMLARAGIIKDIFGDGDI